MARKPLFWLPPLSGSALGACAKKARCGSVDRSASAGVVKLSRRPSALDAAMAAERDTSAAGNVPPHSPGAEEKLGDGLVVVVEEL
jgi:hypothetical protein